MTMFGMSSHFVVRKIADCNIAPTSHTLTYLPIKIHVCNVMRMFCVSWAFLLVLLGSILLSIRQQSTNLLLDVLSFLLVIRLAYLLFCRLIASISFILVCFLIDVDLFLLELFLGFLFLHFCVCFQMILLISIFCAHKSYLAFYIHYTHYI